jgi:hypothetical protein
LEKLELLSEKNKTKFYSSDQYQEYLALENRYRQVDQSVYELKRVFDSMAVDNRLPTSPILLTPYPNQFFIAHRSSLQKQAVLVISLVELSEKNELRLRWQTQLNDLFYDVAAAQKTEEFKKVFSGGTPSLDFQFFDLLENRLVLIYRLHAICIDTDNGTLLWKKRL